MCNSGKGILDGKKAFLAKCNITDESLPIGYIITGLLDFEYESLNIEMASASNFCKRLFELTNNHNTLNITQLTNYLLYF